MLNAPKPARRASRGAPSTLLVHNGPRLAFRRGNGALSTIGATTRWRSGACRPRLARHPAPNHPSPAAVFAHDRHTARHRLPRYANAARPGEVPEWLNGRDWKSRNGGQPRSGVRIPPSPLHVMRPAGARARGAPAPTDQPHHRSAPAPNPPLHPRPTPPPARRPIPPMRRNWPTISQIAVWVERLVVLLAQRTHPKVVHRGESDSQKGPIVGILYSRSGICGIAQSG